MRRIAFLLLVAALQAPAASLVNSGFESGDFTGWQFYGQGWRISTWGKDSRRGIYGVVNDVMTNNAADEYRVVVQEIRASPGKTYAGSVWARAVCLEAAESFLEIQFFSKDGTMLQQFQSPHITKDQDFQYLSISNMVAPEGTHRAGVRGVVHILGIPEQNTDFLIFDNFDFRVQKP